MGVIVLLKILESVELVVFLFEVVISLFVELKGKNMEEEVLLLL